MDRGIRFVVFLQGCDLKCKYCHNRDTWTKNVGNYVDSEEILKEVLKYLPYFKASGGGVTLSGGDPLVQPEFVLDLVRKLKEHDIHVAIDTSGNFEISPIIDEILKYTDLVLMDIKHIDTNKCLRLCGVYNETELEFVQYLDKIRMPVSIRQVIVPGYTDSEEDILKLRDFLKTLNNIKYIELLPYKDFGAYKWKEMGLKYPLDGVRVANDDDIKRVSKILKPDSLISDI